MLVESFGRRLAPRLFSQPQQRLGSSLVCWGNSNHLRGTTHGAGSLFRSAGALRELSYSRMLDMGGAPSSRNDRSLIRTVNASKNSKVQAVAFDFRVLINTNMNTNGAARGNGANPVATAAAAKSASDAKPPSRDESFLSNFVDVDRVKQVASLLNVELGGSAGGKNRDDTTTTAELAAALGQKQNKKTKAPSSSAPPLKDHHPSDNDIRAKYAAKLKGKGGLAGIELAKSQAKDKLTKGDAAGHLAARKIAVQGDAEAAAKSTGAKKWLPSQGASQLLTLLTHRSIRIGLLPILSSGATVLTSNGNEVEEAPRMEDFKAQLKNVIIDKLIPEFGVGGSSSSNNNTEVDDRTIETALRKDFLNELELDPQRVLLVSDRDQYLRVGRDLGMNICRIRPKNARRGSLTAHFTVESIEEVQDVVNEINGISFNVVLNR